MDTSPVEWILFYVLSALCLGGAGLMVLLRNSLAAALSLGLSFLALAGLFALLHAPFVALMQIIIYAGGILVLVVFVIMLLNLPANDPRLEHITRPRMVGSALLVAPLLPILVLGVPAAVERAGSGGGEAVLPAGFGNITGVGALLFSRYVYPFELVSLLLLVAVVVAVVLAKRRL